MVSYKGLHIEAQLVDIDEAKTVLGILNNMKVLKSHSATRCMGLEELNAMADNYTNRVRNKLKIAVVHCICSIMLVDVYDSIPAFGGEARVKCCTRLQCCQIDENEFQRLFGKVDAKYERIWLGDQQSVRR